jgi:chromatin remodeling complex protein RSC6
MPPKKQPKKGDVKKKKAKKAKPRAKVLTATPELAEVIGVKRASKGQMVRKIWDYVRQHRLQDSRNGRWIHPDDKLAKVLGPNRISSFQMGRPLKKHMMSK